MNPCYQQREFYCINHFPLIWTHYFLLNFINLSLRFFPNLIKKISLHHQNSPFVFVGNLWLEFPDMSQEDCWVSLSGWCSTDSLRASTLSQPPSLHGPWFSSRFQLPIVLWDSLMDPKLASKLRHRGWPCTSVLPPQWWIRGGQWVPPHLTLMWCWDLISWLCVC